LTSTCINVCKLVLLSEYCSLHVKQQSINELLVVLQGPACFILQSINELLVVLQVPACFILQSINELLVVLQGPACFILQSINELLVVLQGPACFILQSINLSNKCMGISLNHVTKD
jgi:hypothetical protein